MLRGVSLGESGCFRSGGDAKTSATALGAVGRNRETFRRKSCQIGSLEKLWITPNAQGAFRLKLYNVP
jgi:hypothetical protein